MEVAAETKTTNGYGKPPWSFTGRAVYQLHLVKSEVARALIPKDFRLVEAFGYTLGGFFFANYDHSPAGVFDEMGVQGSCEQQRGMFPWTKGSGASKPCRPVHQEQRRAADTGHRENRGNHFLNMIGFGPATAGSRFRMDTQVTEITVPTPVTEEFSINLLSPVPKENSKMWLGPRIKLSLPSFSGRTEYNPNLLKYSCQMECRVRVIRPLQIFRSSPTTDLSAEEQAVENPNSSSTNQAMEKTKDYRRRSSLSVMLSKPILALEFNCMNMNVENPLIISQ